MLFSFRLQGHCGWLADMLMLPIMCLLQGTLKESPQRTHRWNNQRLTPVERASLDPCLMVTYAGDPKASPRWWWNIPIHHIPILGGWRNYVAIYAETTEEWFPGWVSDHSAVSRIPIRGGVRLLLGPSEALFFGVDRRGRQVKVIHVGRGVIGGNAPQSYRRSPLR